MNNLVKKEDFSCYRMSGASKSTVADLCLATLQKSIRDSQFGQLSYMALIHSKLFQVNDYEVNFKTAVSRL